MLREKPPLEIATNISEVNLKQKRTSGTFARSRKNMKLLIKKPFFEKNALHRVGSFDLEDTLKLLRFKGIIGSNPHWSSLLTIQGDIKRLVVL